MPGEPPASFGVAHPRRDHGRRDDRGERELGEGSHVVGPVHGDEVQQRARAVERHRRGPPHRGAEPRAERAQPPRAYLAGDPDRVAREALERWTVTEAASAHRAWRAGGLDLNVHFAFATLSEAVVDAVAAGFGSDDAAVVGSGRA